MLSHPLGKASVVTSPFGKRGQVSGVKVSTTEHLGTDLRAPVGTPVLASADGVVYAARQAGVYSGPRIFTAALAGNWLLTWHPSLGVYVTFAHLTDSGVKVGQTIRAGQVVAKSGASGGVAPHLHVGVWTRLGTTWTAHDPENYFDFTGKASLTADTTATEDDVALTTDEKAALAWLWANATGLEEIINRRARIDDTFARTDDLHKRIGVIDGTKTVVDELWRRDVAGLSGGQQIDVDALAARLKDGLGADVAAHLAKRLAD